MSFLVSDIFDERNPSQMKMVADVITVCHRKTSICGQAPSDYPEFAQFLVEILKLRDENEVPGWRRADSANRKVL